MDYLGFDAFLIAAWFGWILNVSYILLFYNRFLTFHLDIFDEFEVNVTVMLEIYVLSRFSAQYRMLWMLWFLGRRNLAESIWSGSWFGLALFFLFNFLFDHIWSSYWFILWSFTFLLTFLLCLDLSCYNYWFWFAFFARNRLRDIDLDGLYILFIKYFFRFCLIFYWSFDRFFYFYQSSCWLNNFRSCIDFFLTFSWFFINLHMTYRLLFSLFSAFSNW